MSVFRIERNKNYTVMSNYHLRDTTISLKSKGLLSMMLSLPDEWNYTTRGLAKICKEGVDAIGGALRELEKAGYIVRRVVRNERGRIVIWSTPSTNSRIPGSLTRPGRIQSHWIRKTRIWRAGGRKPPRK